jgi:hypothetical protein
MKPKREENRSLLTRINYYLLSDVTNQPPVTWRGRIVVFWHAVVVL